MNYTKGEWKLTDDGYVIAGEKYVHEPNNFGFEIKAGAIIPKEVMANSRLIAAAPDMYEALKALIEAYSIGHYAMDKVVEELVSPVLVKAEGK